MPTKTLFALDFDGTYTRDPELWLTFIKLLAARGHDVVVATMRTFDERDTMCPKLLEAVPWIVFTSRRAKKEYLAAFGIHPDIWIDDQPHFLFADGAKADELPEDKALASLMKHLLPTH